MSPLFFLSVFTCALFCISPLIASPVEEEPHSPQTQVASSAISEKSINFEDLPEDILRFIGHYLDVRDHHALVQCNKSLKQRVEDTIEGPYYRQETKKEQRFSPSQYPEFQIFMRKAEKYNLPVRIALPIHAQIACSSDTIQIPGIKKQDLDILKKMYMRVSDYKKKYMQEKFEWSEKEKTPKFSLHDYQSLMMLRYGGMHDNRVPATFIKSKK